MAGGRWARANVTIQRVIIWTGEIIHIHGIGRRHSGSEFEKERPMQLGMIGLGRMGANMVRRLLKGGHHCVVFDMSSKAVEALVQEKAEGSSSQQEFLEK